MFALIPPFKFSNMKSVCFNNSFKMFHTYNVINNIYRPEPPKLLIPQFVFYRHPFLELIFKRLMLNKVVMLVFYN